VTAAAARTVLLVENDPDICEIVSDVLSRRGYHALTAGHGLEALEILRGGGERPQVILLDLTMPVMSGWEFMAAQAADPAISDIPVVVMSAVAELERDQPSVSPPPWVGILTKPVSLETLLETVSRFCRSR
jgi:CheY-like chemotaxis protein